jgi:hypothetical protein
MRVAPSVFGSKFSRSRKPSRLYYGLTEAGFSTPVEWSPCQCRSLHALRRAHPARVRDAEATLVTMVEDAYVNHIPVMTGGNGGCASDPRLLDQQLDIGGHRLRVREIGIRNMVQFAAIVLGPWLTGQARLLRDMRDFSRQLSRTSAEIRD